MSAHVLLNLLNELRKRDKMRNKTRARMLDSIYHMIIKITLKSNFCSINVIYATLLWTS